MSVCGGMYDGRTDRICDSDDFPQFGRVRLPMPRRYSKNSLWCHLPSAAARARQTTGPAAAINCGLYGKSPSEEKDTIAGVACAPAPPDPSDPGTVNEL